jgi:hypothetical protein
VDDNRLVNGLWIEGPLSRMELLTLKSFMAHGHQFILWAYGRIPTPLPEGVELRNASEIIPPEQVFCYTKGPHPGSFAGFSDIFRYKLLYERGGWWVDMDITCLKPLEFCQPYVFRRHVYASVVGNLLKVPPRSKLMLDCYEWTREHVKADNTDWLKPVRILGTNIFTLHLQNYIVHTRHFTSDCDDPVRFATTAASLDPDLYAIHWCNEWLKKLAIDKERPQEGTIYHTLLRRYGLA